MVQDINECNREHNCTHYCVNTIGHYKCECPMGYDLAIDGRTCQHLLDPANFQRPQRDHPFAGPSAFLKYAEMVCADGYSVDNEKCLGTIIS